MTSYRCRRCGDHWQEGPTRDHCEGELCRRCIIRDREAKADACEAGTEGARADYYQNLCMMQKGLIEDYRNFLFTSNPQKINAVSPREWDLGRQVYSLDMNCKMLENLVDEYRKELEEAAKRIN